VRDLVDQSLRARHDEEIVRRMAQTVAHLRPAE
jgi:hypothetical protein